MNQSTKLIQKLKQRDKERQLCYRKVGRAITKWGAIEKSSILLSQYWNLSNKPLYLNAEYSFIQPEIKTVQNIINKIITFKYLYLFFNYLIFFFSKFREKHFFNE